MPPGGRELYVQHLGEQAADQAFVQRQDLVHGHERGFDIQLGEFRLPVGTQVLIAEAAGDLVVPVEAGNHQQLLEQLRGLRQREKLTGIGAAGHQIVAGTFRGRARENRRLDIQEAFLIEKHPQEGRHPRAQSHALDHGRPAQIHIPVAQAHILACFFVVEREWRCLGPRLDR